MTRVFVIAEAGVNHNGSLQRALELIDAAARCGADAVKFQTFVAERLVKLTAAKVNYQAGNSRGASQFEMLKHLELPQKDHLVLRDAAFSAGIEFMSTPFDLESLAFLVDVVGVQRIKVSSGDLTNLPLLHAVGRTGLPVIISTGMGTLGDVACALGALAHGRLVRSGRPFSAPGPLAFAELISGPRGRDLLANVTALHCTSEYPAPDTATNLRAIGSLAETFRLPVGLSDHSLGLHMCVAAVSLGASVIEKHLTMDTEAVGPDHRASLNPESFGQMVDAIRSVERAMGTGEKRPSEQEMENATLVRRGIYAARDLSVGDIVTESDIAVLRPENGVPPSRYWALLGAVVTRPLAAGEDLEP